jgi:WD40 repeat protein
VILTSRSRQFTAFSVAWSPDGTRLATAGDGSMARIWDASTGDPTFTLVGHTNNVMAVAWSPDGTRLATAAHDRKARVWDTTTGKAIGTKTISRPKRRSRSGPLSIAWLPAGDRVAITWRDDTVRIWDTARRVRTVARAKRLAWSPDGTRLATIASDDKAQIRDPTTGEITTVLPGTFKQLAWSPDNTRLATTGTDDKAQIRDPASGERTVTLAGQTDRVQSLIWSPNGTHLLTQGWFQPRLWDTTTGRATVILGARHGAPAWSPDGTRLAVATRHRTVEIWTLNVADSRT